RHRMTIEKEITAKERLGLLDKLAERLMIGPIKAFDPSLHLREAQPFRVYFLSVGDHPGDRTETYPHARGRGADEARQRVMKHARIKFVSCAIDIDIGARKAGREEGCAEAWCGAEEFVDKAVLRSPQSQRLEPRGGEKIGWIFGAAMRRSEDNRQAAH